MSNQTPLLSVVIPCYKKAQYLPDTLNSVLDSVYKNYEIIIVNDGSPDHTDQVVQPYLKKHTHIRYIEQENAGVCVARNNGIEQAKGKYILPLDADDLIGKEYILRAIEKFEENKELTIVYCLARKFKKNRKRTKQWFLGNYNFVDFLGMCHIFPACVYKKSDWAKTEGYDVNMIHGIEDWEFLINLLKTNGIRTHQLKYVGYFYRTDAKDSRHSNFNSNENNRQLMFDYIYQKHKEVYQQYYGNLSMHVISEMAYYKYKVDRIENAIKQFAPKAIQGRIKSVLKL